MADEADRADIYIENTIDDAIAKAYRAVADWDNGKPGVCDFCGSESSRLVDGACGWCRDKYRLR